MSLRMPVIAMLLLAVPAAALSQLQTTLRKILLKPGVPKGSVLLAQPAPCADVPVAAFGDGLRDGAVVTLDLVKRGGASASKPDILIGNQAVTLPNLGKGGVQARMIAPRIQKLTMSSDKVVLPSAPDQLNGGWYTAGQTIAIGKVIEDHGDGTAEVQLPAAVDAVFAQQATLRIVTDRCVISGPINITPPMHYGRWFPPGLVLDCDKFKGSAKSFDGTDIGWGSIIQASVPSERPLEDVAQPNSLYQSCSAFGAIHQGGTKLGKTHGVDRMVYWTGGIEASFDVISSCKHQLNVQNKQVGYIAPAPTGHRQWARQAKRDLTIVSVSWQVTAPAEHCTYSILVRGKHPVALKDQWRAVFLANNLGVRSGFNHRQRQSELYWFKRLASRAEERNSTSMEY